VEPDISRVINKLIFRLNHLYGELPEAPTDYAGLSNAVNVHEEELEKLMDHDFTMITLAEEIETKGKELLELTMRGDYDSISKVIEELQETLSRIEEIISSREAFLKWM